MIYVRMPTWLFLALMPCIMAGFFIGLGIWMPNFWQNYERDRRLEENGITMQGVVLDSELSCFEFSDDCTLYEVSYDYTVNGTTYHSLNEMIMDYAPGDYQYKPGDPIDIIYLSDDPAYSLVLSNMDSPSLIGVRLGLAVSGVFIGGLLGLLWNPYRDYSKASFLGSAFFGARFVITYSAIIAFIGLAAHAHHTGASLKIHMLWFYPILGIFGIPWVEINRSGRPKDDPELRREGYKGGSIERIALEIGFPSFLALYLIPLNFWEAPWENDILQGIYIATSCIIALSMARAWRWFEPMFNKLLV